MPAPAGDDAVDLVQVTPVLNCVSCTAIWPSQ